MPDNPKYTSQYSGSQIDAAIDKVGLISDYVIESQKGSDNTWGYVKYNSGVAILWGVFHLDQTSGTYRRKQEADPSGDGRYSNTIYLQTPFKVAYAVVSGGCDNLYMVVNPGGNFDNQNVSFRLWRYAGINDANIWVRVHVTGNWN